MQQEKTDSISTLLYKVMFGVAQGSALRPLFFSPLIGDCVF